MLKLSNIASVAVAAIAIYGMMVSMVLAAMPGHVTGY
jgi:hypothetical protein